MYMPVLKNGSNASALEGCLQTRAMHIMSVSGLSEALPAPKAPGLRRNAQQDASAASFRQQLFLQNKFKCSQGAKSMKSERQILGIKCQTAIQMQIRMQNLLACLASASAPACALANYAYKRVQGDAAGAGKASPSAGNGSVLMKSKTYWCGSPVCTSPENLPSCQVNGGRPRCFNELGGPLIACARSRVAPKLKDVTLLS
mmetsp:Transcript_115332/g.229877  ORF Transcript_115332/g.229877 Transcript_115332/m.229877 type:complete len:201 (+) Transcript_115332:79-681(+)